MIRQQSEEHRDYRGYAGRIASGIFRPNDEIVVLPSGFTSRIKSIDSYTESLEEAFAPMSVTINLQDDIDVSRGDMLAKKNNQPIVTQEVDAMVCWFNPAAAKMRYIYSLLHTTNATKAMITDIVYKIDINSLDRDMDDKVIGMNDICRMKFKTANPIMSDP